MKERSLAEVARWMGANIVRGEQTSPIGGAVIDSRKATAGALFFALEGENCHGIDHAQDALEKGAAAVVSEPGYAARHKGPALEVEDVAGALQSLASEIRREEEPVLPAIAITGSVGKTTTCAILRSLLGANLQVQSPQDSYNNHLGVPITILDAPPETEILILELGTTAPGEIAALAQIARASYGVITSVAPTHWQGLGSIEGVHREKFSLFDHIDGDGLWAPVECREGTLQALDTYRWTGPDGDLEIRRRGSQSVEVLDRCRTREFFLPWSHPSDWVLRCLESAVAMALEIVDDPEQLIEGATRIQLPRWRHEVRTVNGIEMILDCYNSSPCALAAAIEDLVQSQGCRKLAVIGTMEELGEDEQRYHVEAGRHCIEAGVDVVFVCGRAADWVDQGVRSGGGESIFIEDGEAGAEVVKEELRSGDRILFKASRLQRFEQLAQLVEQQFEEQGEKA
ncbi:MAG: Mur ligase family protein [Planctomycetota bacterium]|nr:Mur ligase family protein [Planctomycetota bacterium]